MADESALAIVSAYQDAWTAKDFDRAAAHVADGMEFHSPAQHITGKREFFEMLRGFSGRIGEGWELVSSAESGEGVLILYHLFSARGDRLPCADHFTVHGGRITSELLVFNPRDFAPPPPSAG